jgi:hypothetical protein
MVSDLDTFSSPSQEAEPVPAETAKVRDRGWPVMGVVAAASAVAGCLAAAWFYRKTLAQLRQAESSGQNSEFKSSESGFEEDF